MIKNKMIIDNHSLLSTINIPVTSYITPHLRYVKHEVLLDNQTATYELRLQQMRQYSDGRQVWEWVEIVDDCDDML